MFNVFVYGSLQSPRVVQALLQRMPEHGPATVQGYRRVKVKGQVYPAVRPQEGHSVGGILVQNLSAEELRRFDTFEDEDYTREEVLLVEPSGAKAFIYVWKQEAEDKLEWVEWDMSRDFLPYLSQYLEMCDRFVSNDFNWWEN